MYSKITYCCFSPKSCDIIKTIRVVHLNGHVEDFDHPISVHELMAKSQKHFVFTHAQLLSAASKPLNPDTKLEQGHIYYLLPKSLFQSSVSPMDLVPIARKLSCIAKSGATNTTSSKFGERSNKSRAWKPVLSTIRELSFNRRSESDLQRNESQVHNTSS
ncbi:hypothetical protein EJD97_013616 [Solanum chilense]|uniref:DUF4228 domain-containing protein n=1 Tax=Solanum chilense TaxID=4083 RepID=A0A6N2BAU1_SOLCI|nr:hypothetical protein EJD97_013616 [Solanum chilense]